MIASQFNLDHRLAELRQAGADSRIDRGRIAGHSDGIARGLVDALRTLLGGSPTGHRSVGLAAR